MSDQPYSYRAQYHQNQKSDGRWVWELMSVATTPCHPDDTTRARVTSVQRAYGMIVAQCYAYSFIEAATEFHDFKPESVL